MADSEQVTRVQSEKQQNRLQIELVCPAGLEPATLSLEGRSQKTEVSRLVAAGRSLCGGHDSLLPRARGQPQPPERHGLKRHHRNDHPRIAHAAEPRAG